MGICQYSADRNIVYTTKSLLDKVQGSKGTNFYFSTQPLSKLDGDCLLILSKDCNSLKNNKFLKTMPNKANLTKINKQFQQANKSPTNNNNFVIFDVYVTGLQFTKYAVMTLSQKQYQQNQQNQTQTTNRSQLKQNIVKQLQNIYQMGLHSVVITELQWKSLISKINIFKIICQALMEFCKFKSVVFACLTQQTQSLYMKIVQEIKSHINSQG